MKELKPEKIIETISNKKTGEKYKNDEDWKAKGVPEADIEEISKSLCQALIYLVKPSRLEDTGFYACLNNLAKL